MWKKRLIWKNVALQFEVTTPENIEEEVNAQRDSFVFKASFRDAESVHVVNDIELTIKRRCVKDITTNLIRPEDVKPEPTEYLEREAAKPNGSGLSGPKKEESSGVPDLAQKKQIDDDANVVSAADVASSSSPPDEVNASGKNKSQHLGQRNDEKNDKANSSKKISLKVIDESSRGMLFSVRTSTKMSKLMQNYSKRLSLDASCFKFIFDGRRIIEDETVKQLEMEDGDTINVMFVGTSRGPMTEPEKKAREAKAKLETEIHKYDDRRMLLDLNDNTPKKFLTSKAKDMKQPGDGGGVKRKAVASNMASSKKTKNYGYEY